MADALAGLRKLKVQPELILSSPYVRAWETAVAAARVLTPRRKPEELNALTPSGRPERIWTVLQSHAALQSAMLVGHEPLLSEFAAFAVHSPHLRINLKKAGFIRIDLDSVQVGHPAGTLRWLLTPGQMARMG